jgi:hypothetical protein
MEAEDRPAGSAGAQPADAREAGSEEIAFAIDTGRLGQALVIFGAVILVIHLLLTATSFAVPAESSWMIFNLWEIDRFVTVIVVCCVLIGLGWLLCRGKGCKCSARDEA